MLSAASRFHYASADLEFLHTALTAVGPIRVVGMQAIDTNLAMITAVRTIRLAQSLSIPTPARADDLSTPYGSNTRQVSFDAPLLSELVGKPISFLRGWEMFESCVKGYNALGLMAEQVEPRIMHLQECSDEERSEAVLRFLRDRIGVGGGMAFEDAILYDHRKRDKLVAEVDLQDLALWQCFASRPVVCSTSSNLGISLHDAFTQMRAECREVAGRPFHLFNENEGRLVIWCPDERADFMNPEKAETLHAIVDGSRGLTTIRTYIDRQQRDPGALSEALVVGGYFFPTNPQSVHEMQSLLQFALGDESGSLEESVRLAVSDELSRLTLESLGCRLLVEVPAIQLSRGVEGGIYGLMVPYLLLHEEMALAGDLRGLSVWNQASIGASLAAAVLAGEIISDPESLRPEVLGQVAEVLPALGALMEERSSERPGGRDTEIRGVFDLANIQSLAQLLGVVVNRHYSGRSTAYVGLGSSSYSNGNRCFEILDTNVQMGGSFKGRSHFHPATHAINPVAQALIVGEDVARARRVFDSLSVKDSELVAFVRKRIRKPEPAGATALAGYLLYCLDEALLSVFEITHMLRVAGFTRYSFLGLINDEDLETTEREYLRLAVEEGPFMGQFATDLLNLLDWPVRVLDARSGVQRKHRAAIVAGSRDTHMEQDWDDTVLTVLYVTGDNTAQPGESILKSIIDLQVRHEVTTVPD